MHPAYLVLPPCDWITNPEKQILGSYLVVSYYEVSEACDRDQGFAHPRQYGPGYRITIPCYFLSCIYLLVVGHLCGEFGSCNH